MNVYPDEQPESPIGRKHRETGQHPSIRITNTDGHGSTPVRTGLESSSDLQRDQEPEDNLPDHLDKNK